jgi:signal transduction histidine kinase
MAGFPEHDRERLGVIIHDLNNRLGVIVSYAALLRPQLPDAGATADLAEIRVAAEQAVALARELAAVVASEPPAPPD